MGHLLKTKTNRNQKNCEASQIWENVKQIKNSNCFSRDFKSTLKAHFTRLQFLRLIWNTECILFLKLQSHCFYRSKHLPTSDGTQPNPRKTWRLAKMPIIFTTSSLRMTRTPIQRGNYFLQQGSFLLPSHH